MGTVEENKEVAEIFNKIFDAYNSKDVDFILNSLSGNIGEFGCASSAWRDQKPSAEGLTRWFDSFDYLKVTINELHTWSQGETGIAWGIYTQDFKHKEQPPERMRIRITATFIKTGGEWQPIIRHSDAQPFNEDGSYLKEFTQVK